ncbi:variant 4, Pectin acetylesterase 5 [Lathyrus oleraceus]|uniref:Pectin acetylesterase n=1 Tax=Pisum sativum TaxID=3888 RepID=A0A9D4Y426_PEA|nr:variant 4, Pectin acetylesterase 5 [Pisum sativum]
MSPCSITNNLLLRNLSIFFRKWTTKVYTIAAFALILFLSYAFLIRSNPDSTLSPSTSTSLLIPFTPLTNFKQIGALCLDGSAPGYHFQKGFGSGSRNWLLHLEGGGWCSSIASCSYRKTTALGSSNYMDSPVLFSGMLSSVASQNPDFFNWNKVKIRYCDGASFAGHPESEALLTGCSAGGLASLIHCDNFRHLLPKGATVKCLADAGFFLDEKDILGNSTMKSFYKDVVQLQGVAKSLHKKCLAKMEPSKCLFSSEILKNIKTPVFLVHPAYDFWQIHNILVPQGSDPHHRWKSCRLNIQSCDANLMDTLNSFRSSLLRTVNEFQQRKDIGMFIDSCFIHCQTLIGETWYSPNSPKINNKTIAESVADWFFDRQAVKLIDCPYPCNPTCHNLDFTRV